MMIQSLLGQRPAIPLVSGLKQNRMAMSIVEEHARSKSRRWHPFSLSSLLGIMAIFAILLGVWINSGRRQAAAVQTIRAHGGRVLYRQELTNSSTPYLMVPDGIREFISDDLLMSIVNVDFPEGGRELGDAWAALNKLHSLRGLNTNNSGITDAALSSWKGLRRCEKIRLLNEDVTDEGMKLFAKCSNLVLLDLGGNRVTDEGLKNLRNLHALTILDLSRTDVTDAGLRELHSLSSLGHLKLERTNVSSDGVRGLQRMLPKCIIEY